ncbi:uncharacterized protein PV07_04422 [Cladophialophora immunda]|uniref:Uncharacterized protein n=1 Tax=Cladophialophora immunda TaxID=569365 RepID=A0A0D2DB39_9EURO|nr:uncharacterized protein PV07_04422 [Cladophialophora immunda]KIW32909.1 hypothetical protein PV07_04422 [Cladophialophora immunda]
MKCHFASRPHRHLNSPCGRHISLATWYRHPSTRTQAVRVMLSSSRSPDEEFLPPPSLLKRMSHIHSGHKWLDNGPDRTRLDFCHLVHLSKCASIGGLADVSNPL